MLPEGHTSRRAHPLTTCNRLWALHRDASVQQWTSIAHWGGRDSWPCAKQHRQKLKRVSVSLHETRHEEFMNITRVCLIAAVLVCSSEPGWAQDLFRYRAYVLESTLGSVIATSGARAADTKTLYERPQKIQELEWRAPYASSSDRMADPVRGAVFTFVNDALYQIVVKYDRDRTDGLSEGDLVESLTTVYGQPAPKAAKSAPVALPQDTVRLALWESAGSWLALVRGANSPDFQLILISKTLSTRARDAIRESGRLDVIEAPRREEEQRKRELEERDAARAKARTSNKAAFRP